MPKEVNELIAPSPLGLLDDFVECLCYGQSLVPSQSKSSQSVRPVQVVIDPVAAILEGTWVFAVVADTGCAVDRVLRRIGLHRLLLVPEASVPIP